MRVLVDTSAYISYLLNPSVNSTIHFILEKVLEEEITLLIAADILDEIEITVRRKPYLIGKITDERLTAFIETLKIIAETVLPIELPIPQITRDVTDDYLIAYAVIGEADYLVSVDKDLLVLGTIGDIKIVHTREFKEQFSSFA